MFLTETLATNTGLANSRFSAQQKHLCLIKFWFSASIFVVKITNFAKPENYIGHRRENYKVIKIINDN